MIKKVSPNSDLDDRLVEFAVTCIKISRGIRNDFIGQYFRNQLIRSGSSPALNYAEARYAESKNDFIHKVKIVLKELHETRVCVKVLVKANCYAGNDDLERVSKECNELIAIFVTSVNTAMKSLVAIKP